MRSAEDLERLIRNVPDFPRPPVVFKDITTVLTAPGALGDAVTLLERKVAGFRYDAIAAIESRGFVFGAVMAERRGLPLVLIRKPGKLPAETIGEDYDLEYGSARIEMHLHSLEPGTRVLIVDDLVATGGSAAAACRLIERDGCVVAGAGFMVNLEFLGGRKRLEAAGYPVGSIVRVDSE